jgi:hypothetical protein
VQDVRDEDDMEHCVLPSTAKLNGSKRLFGHEDRMVVSWDRAKGEMRIQRDSHDLGVAFHSLPMTGPLFPFIHLDSAMSSVEISAVLPTINLGISRTFTSPPGQRQGGSPTNNLRRVQQTKAIPIDDPTQRRNRGNMYMKQGARFIARNKRAGVALEPIADQEKGPALRRQNYQTGNTYMADARAAIDRRYFQPGGIVKKPDIQSEIHRLRELVRRNDRKTNVFATPRNIMDTAALLDAVQKKIQLVDKLYHLPKL